MWLYPGGRAACSAPAASSAAAGARCTAVTAGRDLTGDERNDLLAVDRRGALLVYPGNGRGGFDARRSSWTPPGAPQPVLGVGDWDRDGRVDVIGRRRGRPDDHPLRRRPARRWRRRCAGATAGTALRVLAAPGDWDGDGRADLLAVSRPTASLLLYRGHRRPRLRRPEAADACHLGAPPTPSSWSATSTATATPRCVSRTTAGDLLLSRGAAGGAVRAPELIGARWGGDGPGDGGRRPVRRRRARPGRAQPLGRQALPVPALPDGRRSSRRSSSAPAGTASTCWSAPARWDDDPWTDLLARRSSDDALLLYPGTSTGRLGTGPRQVGSALGRRDRRRRHRRPRRRRRRRPAGAGQRHRPGLPRRRQRRLLRHHHRAWACPRARCCRDPRPSPPSRRARGPRSAPRCSSGAAAAGAAPAPHPAAGLQEALASRYATGPGPGRRPDPDAGGRPRTDVVLAADPGAAATVLRQAAARARHDGGRGRLAC